MASTTATANLEPFKIGTLPSLYLIPEYISPTMEQHFLTNILATQSGWKQVSGRRLLNIGGVVTSKGSLLQTPMPSWGLQPLITEISDKFQLYHGAPANHVLINSYSEKQGIMSHQDGPLYCPVVAILSLGSTAIIRFTKKKSIEEETTIEDNGSSRVDIPSNIVNTATAPNDCGFENVPTVSVVLPPRSLFIFKDDAYEQYLHGIDFVEEEILDESVVNPIGQVVEDEKNQGNETNSSGAGKDEDEATEELPLPLPEAAAPLKVKREGTRVSLTIRRVLRVHSLGILRR